VKGRVKSGIQKNPGSRNIVNADQVGKIRCGSQAPGWEAALFGADKKKKLLHVHEKRWTQGGKDQDAGPSLRSQEVCAEFPEGVIMVTYSLLTRTQPVPKS